MSVLPRVAAAMTAEWPDLIAELDRWGEAGKIASLWWRDDDAAAATPALSSLLRLAGDVPLALAVIPAELDPDLPGFLRPMAQVAVLQHGWRHANHAAPGAKKSEYPASRAEATVSAELTGGHDRLAACFGPQACRCWCRPGTASRRSWCQPCRKSALPASRPSVHGDVRIP